MLESAQQFLSLLRPALEAGDPAVIAQTCNRHWTNRELASLLYSDEAEARQAAALVLGLVGDLRVEHQLIRALKDPELQVNRAAEHALWSIWFRSCSCRAGRTFEQAMEMITQEKHATAVDLFTQTLRIDPGFGEAYHQRGIAHYLMGRWESALEDCCRTIRLRPMHFGAVAGLGHCFTQLGELRRALRCYRKALHIHPHMSAVADAIRSLEPRMRGSNDSSGVFESIPVEV
ncbi:MAG: tetratricopeptide repeat protein [Phycisphaeraceae bacterium]|nr:tetratricopeptide repeat protein [Phycisphaeraceae bacterium]